MNGHWTAEWFGPRDGDGDGDGDGHGHGWWGCEYHLSLT